MPKKILVVDDDPHIVDYLADLFTDHGYEVVSARDGAAGLEALKKSKADLITLDIDMPEDAGPKFYRNMTKDEALKDIPVIVVSGIAGPQRPSIKKVVATVSKPFDADELVKLVRKTIGAP